MSGSNNAEANVTIESALHELLRRIAQDVWNEHNICIQEVRISWLNTSTVGKRINTVNEIELKTSTKEW